MIRESGPPPGKQGAGLAAVLFGDPAIMAATALLIIAAAYAARAAPGWPPEIRIGLGFFFFFVAPGLMMSLAFFPHKRFWILERLPISIALSMGVWAFPGLLAYRMGWPLDTVAMVEAAITLVLLSAAMIRRVLFKVRPDADPCAVACRGNFLIIGLITAALALLCLWTGAFRGLVLDWDYYNYISAVRKLAAWNRASIAHPIYLDAPPDPIHSYNIWALQWALISKFFRVDPIPLYLHAAFITVPAAALSFYALGRRMFSSGVARTAFFIFVSYQVLYGGLIFVGRTTFYPADSQWLITFPACLVLFLRMFDDRWDGLLFGLTLAVLGMSIVHVLWGLAFFMVCGSFLALLLLRRHGIGRSLAMALRTGRGFRLSATAAFAAIPLLFVFITAAVMAGRGDLGGYTPLFGGGTDFSPWFYAFAFVVMPGLYLLWLAAPYRPRRTGDPDPEMRFMIIHAGYILAMCLLVALPYAVLRHNAIASTNWEQFGRNPYRAFITPALFFLNPFQRSLGNPNMTFFPLYLAGYACLPVLLLAKKQRHAALLALGALVAVPLICFHPCLATLFADYFSLGYLRRILRVAALFCFFPPAFVVFGLANAALSEDKRPALHMGLAMIAAALIGLICISAAAPSYYNRMLSRTISIARHYPADSLLQDDEPFTAIREGGWFSGGEVIFSDIWTSYRLTAHLPLFVGVQAKPGTGVADQDQRRLMEIEFFEPATPAKRMREILEWFQAAGVIINRNPAYNIYGIPCGHPEAAGKLKADPENFQILHDHGDWVIARVRG